MPDRFPAPMPHDSLQPIMDDAWFLTGTFQIKPLVRYARNMVVLRHDDELTLVNSVRLNEQGEADLAALGKVAHVMKIGFHGVDDDYYVDRYGARRWTVDDLRGDASLPVPDLEAFLFRDTRTPEAALLLRRSGGLLITCDSVQHWAPSHLNSPLARLVTRWMGFQRAARIGPPWLKMQTPPGGSLKADFERLLGLPFQRLIGGHGGLLETDAVAVLKRSVEGTFPA